MTADEVQVAYPEHDKIMSRSAEHDAIVDFLNMLEDHGLQIMRIVPEEQRSYRNIVEYEAISFVDLIAEHFNVDQAELEREKRRMLGAIREELDS